MPPVLRSVLRLIAAVVLLAGAVWLVGPERLARQWTHIDRAWFCAALLSAALAQWVSVLRWEMIARIFGLRVRTRSLALAYAQGMTLNVLLPGATLGGDALRSVRLQGLGNPLAVSALTVLLDRLSGLWVLCVLSLLTGIGLALVMVWSAAAGSGPGQGVLAQALPPPFSSWGAAQLLWAYLAGLTLVCAIPWLPLPGAPGRSAGTSPQAAPGLARRFWRRICGLHQMAVSERVPLARSLWSSVLVQLLCALTLWLCVLAAGGNALYWQVQAAAAPVFVAGALPVSYGGFGARELAALAVFPLVGLPADLGLAASVLYGVVAIVLGLAAAPSFALTGMRAPGRPGA